MPQIMSNVLLSINYNEILSQLLNSKDSTDSPSTLRKFLGRGGEDRDSHKFLSGANQQALLNATAAKSLAQRKNELMLAKDVTGAIDRHVREVCFQNSKYLNEVIHKLSGICQSDLHLLR